MKTTSLLAAALVSASSSGVAASYTDSTGDIAVGSFPHIDITSVDVSYSASTLTFKVNLAGDPVTTDWGKYMVGIDSTVGGDTAGNGWGRPISMSSGMDYFLGGWADSGNGAEVRAWDGTAWVLQSATYGANPDNISVSKDASSFSFTLNYAGLGLSEGSAFKFDVYSSGGGSSDSAVDASSNPNPSITSWAGPYDSGALLSSYPVVVVPEPASLALLGLGGLFLALRRP